MNKGLFGYSFESFDNDLITITTEYNKLQITMIVLTLLLTNYNDSVDPSLTP